MGYIICSHLNVKIFEDNILEKPIEEVINNMKKKGLSTWETEQFDSTFNYFNEDNWLVLQTEFGLVNKVELGVVQKNLDEFNW
jgi:pyruvate/oxaloacetate carboxyltransferase